MSTKYILELVGYKTSLNPAVGQDRAILLRYLNQAAKELYHMSDMAGCLDEQLFKVNSNQTIALPDTVGQIRAMREAYNHTAISLQQMRPYYNQFNWESEWKAWRLKGLHPLQTTLTNQSNIVLSVKAVEANPIVVSIAGPSDGSSMTSETITMSSTSMTTVNTYNDITVLSKSGNSQYDVIVSDIDGNQLSYIPSNKTKAEFQIVDVSTAPWWPPNLNPLIGWVDVLYKKALVHMYNDTDEFVAPDYDDVLVNKCLQMFYEEQSNVQVAASYYQKAQQMLAQIHEDANRGTNDCVALVEFGHDKMTHRVGYGRDWQFAYRLTGR